MAAQEEVDEKKKQTQMLLVGIALVVALALAIWSGVRAFDDRPRIVGKLVEDPMMEVTGGAGGGAISTPAPDAGGKDR